LKKNFEFSVVSLIRLLHSN